MIQYIQTQQQFDIGRMQEEVIRLAAGNWKAHYNTTHYEGDWDILPLRAINGNLDNTFAVHASASQLPYLDTVLLQSCPYLASILQDFRCEQTSVRLMKLKAGALIKEHTDHDMHLEAGEARFHIPVLTNPDVAFYIKEDRIPMQAGECWYLNLSLPHRVHNAGQTDRIHLVIDCLVNDWVKELLDAPGLLRKDIDDFPATQAFSDSDLQRIIAELRNQDTPASLQLIADLTAAHNPHSI